MKGSEQASKRLLANLVGSGTSARTQRSLISRREMGIEIEIECDGEGEGECSMTVKSNHDLAMLEVSTGSTRDRREQSWQTSGVCE